MILWIFRKLCPFKLRKFAKILLSSQLLWNYPTKFNETWYTVRTSYVVLHISRKYWSSKFYGSYAPSNLENLQKSLLMIWSIFKKSSYISCLFQRFIWFSGNLIPCWTDRNFLLQHFIHDIAASDAGTDIIRSHLFSFNFQVFIMVRKNFNVICWHPSEIQHLQFFVM